jgi:hypothetical protein
MSENSYQERVSHKKKKRLDRGEEQFRVIQMRGGKERKMTKRSTK